jgi:hypothetical protein
VQVVRGRDEPLVTIATFDTPFEASLARGALEAIGIRALVPGGALGTFTRNRGGLSLTELRVFASDRDRAIVELNRLRMDVVTRHDQGPERG